MSLSEIIDRVSKITGVSREAMVRKGRQSRTVFARTMAVHAIRTTCNGWSLQNIGDIFSRDHTSVLADLRRHADFMAMDKNYLAAYIKLTTL